MVAVSWRSDHLPSLLFTMIAGLHPVVQSLLGTLLTWGLTAAGAGLVFVFQGGAKVDEHGCEENQLVYIYRIQLLCPY